MTQLKLKDWISDSILFPLEVEETHRELKSTMTAERVMRWMFEFGTGYVACRELDSTWVDSELTWRVEIRDGYLKPQRIYKRIDIDEVKPFMSKMKLTQKALDLLKENDDGDKI